MKERKRERLELSGEELVHYMKRFNSYEEFATRKGEDINEFVRDVHTLTESISNLYEANKVPLAMSGVVVKVEVTAKEKTLLEAQIGDKDTADAVARMLKQVMKCCS